MALDRLGETVLGLQAVGEIVPTFGEIRLRRHGMAQMRFRGLKSADRVQRQAQAHLAGSVTPINRVRPAKQFDRLHEATLLHGQKPR